MKLFQKYINKTNNRLDIKTDDLYYHEMNTAPDRQSDMWKNSREIIKNRYWRDKIYTAVNRVIFYSGLGLNISVINSGYINIPAHDKIDEYKKLKAEKERISENIEFNLDHVGYAIPDSAKLQMEGLVKYFKNSIDSLEKKTLEISKTEEYLTEKKKLDQETGNQINFFIYSSLIAAGLGSGSLILNKLKRKKEKEKFRKIGIKDLRNIEYL